MDQDETFWDIVTIDKIAENFKIPFLAEMIEKNVKLSVNMDHVSGFFEEEGERCHFMPMVEFHPMEDGNGFKILIFDVHSDEQGNDVAEVFSFYKSEEEPGNYKVFLGEDDDLLSEVVSFPPSDNDDQPEEYPYRGPGSERGSAYENPFKKLDHNPTIQDMQDNVEKMAQRFLAPKP